MGINNDKSHLLISKNRKAVTNINSNYIESEGAYKVLGITAKSNLKSLSINFARKQEGSHARFSLIKEG